MPVAANDVLKLTAKQVMNGIDDVVNTFHVIVDVLPTPNTDAAVLEDVAEYLGESYSQLASSFPNALDANIIYVYNVTQDAPVGETSWGGGYTGGTASAEGLPQQDAMLALYSTGVKRRVGRTYFGPFTEAAQAGGEWGGATLSAAATCIAELRNESVQSNGSVFVLGVWSKSNGVITQVSTVRIQPLVASMRTRKPGRGS